MFKKLYVIAILLSSSVYAYKPQADIYDFYTNYKQVLLDLYHDIDAVIPQEERDGISKTGGSPVYGEIVFDSVAALLAELKLTSNDVFYDLGSGLGKFVVQVYLTTPAKKSVGIEFSQSRCKRALSVQPQVGKLYNETMKFENKMRKTFGKPALSKTKQKKCNFICGDILEVDLSDATVVFTCSTCFGDEFMEKLTDKLAMIDGLRIVSLRQLPSHPHLHEDTTLALPMTWAPDVAVYMYTVKL